MHSFDDEEKLELTSPQPSLYDTPLDVQLFHSRQEQHADNVVEDADEILIPESPPLPHAHPLKSLSDNHLHTITLQDEEGGMAIYSIQHILFSDQSGADRKRQDPVLMQLNEQEKALAATEASTKRHELLQTARQAVSDSRWRDETHQDVSNGERDSALARASKRKVGKQLNAKWVQMRQDPFNRPKGPLERPDERELRETLYRTTVRDLLRSGVLFDEVDAARNATFGPMSITQMSLLSSGIVGLAGCCFETYEDAL